MTIHHTEHSIVVAAPPRSVYDLVSDVTLWPAVFGPTVYARQLQRTGDQERCQLWALVNGAVSTWISRRVLDAMRLHVSFRQEASQPPIASMGGDWEFLALGDGRTEVRLTHHFTSVRADAEQVEWITTALDRNSQAELGALARVAGLGIPVAELVFSFEDVVQVPGRAADVYEFIDRGDLWAELLPHVEQSEVTALAAGVQRLEMTTVTADGARHHTRSIRIGVPGEWIAYKQEVTPALLTGHSGLWSFTEDPAGSTGATAVTARHTVAVNAAAVTSALGPGTTLTDARQYLRDSLSRNSRATLAHAAASAR